MLYEEALNDCNAVLMVLVISTAAIAPRNIIGARRTTAKSKWVGSIVLVVDSAESTRTISPGVVSAIAMSGERLAVVT